MATLTIKNVPDSVVRRLKARAERHRRSLNSEVIDILASAGQATPIDVGGMLARARATRLIAEDAKLSPKQLKAWINSGRP
ncbi:MAG: Arc family DNA-binding protein [Candidatus Rokubacteria bacterium]|nr:Arc family DNA-binding protein [Candidatus Rokubacteria bacterium]